MTEDEWIAGDAPEALLARLDGTLFATQRKMRLFVLAACRQVQAKLREPFVRLIAAAEEAAERNILLTPGPTPARSRFHDALMTIRHYDPTEIEGEVQSLAGWAYHGVARASTCAGAVRGLCPPATPAEQAELVRELFGNPYRKIWRVGHGVRARVDTWPPEKKPRDMLFVRDWLAWEDGLILRLAESIYETRDFSRMPILADALEEAGCAEVLFLDHLRGGGPHARGCWALDLILSRS